MWLAGVSSLVAAERRAGKALWEWWLDALSFRADSAGRLHIRQLLSHPDTSTKFRNLFEYLDVSLAGALDAESVVRFSDGIQGTVRVLLDKDRRARRDASREIDIPPSLPARARLSSKISTILFPIGASSRPHRVLSLAKLVLVRRIVKALVHRHDLHTVRRGMRAPIVVDVVVRAPRRRRAGVSSAHSRAQHRAGSGGIQTGRHSGVAGTGRRSMRRHARRQTRRARVVGG